MACRLQLRTTVLHHELCSITDRLSYNLMIYAEASPTSDLPLAYTVSPLATLGRYEGLATDEDAPAWTRIAVGHPFELRQPREAIAEVFSELAWWPENCSVRRLGPSMLKWSKIAMDEHAFSCTICASKARRIAQHAALRTSDTTPATHSTRAGSSAETVTNSLPHNAGSLRRSTRERKPSRYAGYTM